MGYRALVVDDEQATRKFIGDILRDQGCQVWEAKDADEALALLGTKQPDLLILDVGLPGFSGTALCKEIKTRRDTSTLPVIMVSARSREDDKVFGFESGADDYITKPFSAKEFMARVQALMRRVQSRGMPEIVLRSADLTVNMDRHTVEFRSKQIFLRPKEFDLLVLFLRNKERILSRRQIRDSVWGATSEVSEHTINVTVANLREALGPVAGRITSVVGLGYKYTDE